LGGEASGWGPGRRGGGDRRALVAKVAELRAGEGPTDVPGLLEVGPDEEEAVRRAVGQRLEERGRRGAEDRGVRANAEAEGEDDDREQARRGAGQPGGARGGAGEVGPAGP